MGILIFVGIAIFSNQNIQLEAYNYIISTRDSTNFKKLQTDIKNNVKWRYGESASDTYALYINDAISEINKGIDYHIDYLLLEEGLTKGEQDKLVNLYDKYILEFNLTKKNYDEYISYYKLVNEDPNEAAKNILRNKAVYLVQGYTKCYKAGSSFFKYLVDVYKKYCLNGKNYYTYESVGYMIECGIVDNSLSYIELDMRERNESATFNKNARTHDLVDNFYDFVSQKQQFGDDDILRDLPFKNFVTILRMFNIYEWAGNYSQYYLTLSDDYKNLSNKAFDFYSSKFREV